MTPPDPLRRFIDAQDGVYEIALAELRAGRKRSHWMWFIFPQIAGLGMSSMAVRYAIADAAEASAYLDHPVLGPRLIVCVGALLVHRSMSAETIMGEVDAMKLRSSMTLFDRVAVGEGVFRECLEAFFRGALDPRTLAILDEQKNF